MCKSQNDFNQKGQPEDEREIEDRNELDIYFQESIEKQKFLFDSITNLSHKDD